MIDAIITGIQGAVEQVKLDPAWEITAFVGEGIFGGRFLLQWLVSEIKKESYVPTAFWYMSILGSLILLAYFTHKQSLALMIAFALQIPIYGRNLILINRKKALTVKMENQNGSQ